MSALFGHLSTQTTSGLVDDDIILVLLGIVWPLLEKLFRSSHMENVSLSAAVCRSLSSAIHSCGKLNGFLNWEIWSCIANVSAIWFGFCILQDSTLTSCYIKFWNAYLPISCGFKGMTASWEHVRKLYAYAQLNFDCRNSIQNKMFSIPRHKYG